MDEWLQIGNLCGGAQPCGQSKWASARGGQRKEPISKLFEGSTKLSREESNEKSMEMEWNGLNGMDSACSTFIDAEVEDLSDVLSTKEEED